MATQNDRPSESPSHNVRQRLLIVEDERKVANALREGLEGENYRVMVEDNGEAAFFRLNTEQFDLVLLDLGLPARDGLDILKALRDDNNEIPVLILTARDTTADRVNGLRTGADDYLVKPFAFAELLARIEVLLRRGKVTSTQRLIAGDIEIDLQTRHVTRNRQLIELTAKEYEFLVYLMQHDQQVVSRETIARELWPKTVRSTTLNNIIDVHISRLRRKIECGNLTKVIHTVRGVGFMLREEKP